MSGFQAGILIFFVCSCSFLHSHPKLSAFNLISDYVNVQEKAAKTHGYCSLTYLVLSGAPLFFDGEPIKTEKCY